jgi:hypothetical protein
MKRLGVVLIVLSLAACQNVRRAEPAVARTSPLELRGVYDNHEQIWRAREISDAAPPSHVVISIEATREPDWSLWHVHLDAAQALDTTWAIHRTDSNMWTPHRAAVVEPAPASAFDALQWTPLDACTLRSATSSPRFSATVAACTAVAPGIGAQAALLPLDIEHDGEWLHVRLYADQARGADAREDLRLVRWFSGWAAINGGGQKADAASRDWHMDRALRIGSEGGRYALKWRDGGASGYSLVLERLTYREGNVPVLKLSVVTDADGATLAYAWANPEATRIGINLGWVQVGLDLETASQ